MLDIGFVRDHPDIVKKAIADKRLDLDLDRLLDADRRRRALQQEMDQLRSRRNELSAAIPKAPPEQRPALVDEARQVRERLAAAEPESVRAQAEFDGLMLLVPSVPAPEVPVGEGEDDNVEVRRWGTPRTFDFEPRDHVDLALSLGLVNFDGPRRYAGGRSYALVGDGALLELAVLRYAVDVVAARGFLPVIPPVMVWDKALEGTGFFPLGREDTFAIEKDGLFLTGTSEVGLVSLHRDDVLDEARLPIRYVGHSTCFRREAGAHGRDTRGLYRVFQFQKVEQVSFVPADASVSEEEHYRLLSNAEAVLQGLGIPYRIALACTGEIGLGQVRKHEVESWMPSRGKYSETHSCSTLHDFQARRSNIRYRDAAGRLRFVYTLNNTAVASPRILIPLLENFQNADGTVTIPEALRPYMGGRSRIEPRSGPAAPREDPPR
ncbi:serine--tRNA ligase [Myxococcota bacterium]|nr:serine--tRNA ligase [Myxococcota bacterium]